MRSTRGFFALIAALAVLAFTFAGAGALISGTSSSVVTLSPAPPSVRLNALENATKVYAFDEAQGITLPTATSVDATAPGTYTSFPNGTAKLAAGTIVDSHLIHSDIPSRNFTARRTGSVTFAGPVVGIIASTSRLAASDNLGAPGTLYAGTTQWRGLESGEFGSSLGDRFTISADHKTVSFDVQTYVMDEIRVLTAPSTQLSTTIADSPDPVTAGNDVQYTLTVTNTGATAVADAHVVDTLPAGTTLKSTNASGGCTGTGPVDCALGALAVGASAQAQLVVTSPSTVPSGGTMTNSAVASPGSGASATETTTVEAPVDGVSKGFVSPGGSITISGDDPATLTLPNTGTGAPVVITQGAGTFCDGPCSGTATTISEFGGYSDPNQPIHLHLVYTFPDSPTSLTDAATAFGSTIYKNTDPNTPNVGSPVPFCSTLGAGVAVPHPCIDARAITQPSPNSFEVSFDVLYISGDPKFALR